MPNHVRNSIQFGRMEDAAYNAVVAEMVLNDGDDLMQFDFNRLIPMPESLDISSGTKTNVAISLYQSVSSLESPEAQLGEVENVPVYANGRLKSEIENAGLNASDPDVLKKFLETDIGKSLLALGEIAFTNIQKYGDPTWYEWCTRNWGTKWNSYDLELDAGKKTISFSTAWSCPHPIVRAFAAKFPGIDFDWNYADEDIGCNTGFYCQEGGVLSCTEHDDCSSDAIETYVTCWGATDGVYKDGNGKWCFDSGDEDSD